MLGLKLQTPFRKIFRRGRRGRRAESAAPSRTGEDTKEEIHDASQSETSQTQTSQLSSASTSPIKVIRTATPNESIIENLEFTNTNEHPEARINTLTSVDEDLETSRTTICTENSSPVTTKGSMNNEAVIENLEFTEEHNRQHQHRREPGCEEVPLAGDDDGATTVAHGTSENSHRQAEKPQEISSMSRRSSLSSSISFASSLTFEDDISYATPSANAPSYPNDEGVLPTSLIPFQLQEGAVSAPPQQSGSEVPARRKRTPVFKPGVLKEEDYGYGSAEPDSAYKPKDLPPTFRPRVSSEDDDGYGSAQQDPACRPTRALPPTFKPGVLSEEDYGYGSTLPPTFKPGVLSEDDYGYGSYAPSSFKPGVLAEEDYGYGSAEPDVTMPPPTFKPGVLAEEDYGYGSAAPDVHKKQASPQTPLVVGRGAAPRRSSMKLRSAPSDERVRTPRRASIQVGGNFKTACEIRRASITFATKEEVEVIEPIKKLMENPNHLWYKKDEIRDMREENKLLVKQQELGLMSPRECTRGLESSFAPGRRLEKQKKIWDSVLALQKLQKQTGRKDAEYVRRLSMFYTSEAMDVATKRAQDDADEIAEYLRETQKQVRRMSMM
eukprot:CAMPEP_0178894398 /NCGR_PEP_ID=MMETSP0747-20121128/20536_1 /TAXON_ID=913974 /ORGANISM="Nitzschia punctata, Strain CCMP561" /LENGTH=608 /DNA_ID=CAMNT_0020564477 /DNA_START=368 /DNA_END=2195 /DNA_ORIENTATION=+